MKPLLFIEGKDGSYSRSFTKEELQSLLSLMEIQETSDKWKSDYYLYDGIHISIDDEGDIIVISEAK